MPTFRISTSFSLSLIPLYQVFINETPVFSSLLQFWRCALEENIQAQNQSGDAWRVGGCQGNFQGLLYVLEVILTELTRKYHEESTLALRNYQGFIIKKKHQACSPYWYLSIAKINRARLSISTNWKDTSYKSILIMWPGDSLRGFINGFRGEIYARKAPVTIRSWWEWYTINRRRWLIHLGL